MTETTTERGRKMMMSALMGTERNRRWRKIRKKRKTMRSKIRTEASFVSELKLAEEKMAKEKLAAAESRLREMVTDVLAGIWDAPTLPVAEMRRL